MSRLRFIGDCHGKTGDYYIATQNCDYSVQIGDLGYDWSILEKVDPEFHKLVPGNHDAYPDLDRYRPWILHPYGVLRVGTFEAFYLAGAYSIDRSRRIKDFDWFPEEELPFEDLYRAYVLYRELRPRVLIAHEGPTEAIEVLGMKGIRLDPPFKVKSTTQQALQMMIEAHRPEEMIFGHWHLTTSKKKDGCTFRCLGELHCKDYEV